MKKDTKRKFGEITLSLLEIISRTPECLANAFLDHRSLSKILSNKKEYLSDNLIQHLRNLNQAGYVEINNNTKNMSIRLTTKGKIKNLENLRDEQADSQLRIISYDIPERFKGKRQQLCRHLRRIGFRQLQKSLWVCKYIKASQIDLVIDELSIREYVAYFVVAKSNIDKHISKLLEKH